MPLPWPRGPENPQLARGAVHVWCAELSRPVEPFWPLLAHDEQMRANRFRFVRDKTRYVAARGILRLLLGAYLGVAPKTVLFEYSKFGKPFLLDGTLQFNVSHSHDVALFAFCWGSVVGVDVEGKRPLSDLHALAQQVFSPTELQALHALPHDQQQDAFFRAWARKEAFIKAVGEGFSYPLKQFDVTLAPADPAKILRINQSVAEATAWYLTDLPPLPDFSSALVVEQGIWQLSCWQWV